MAAAQVARKRFDMLKTLAPISLTGVSDGVLVAPANSPFRTVKELIDFARANPGVLNCGSVGPGSREHLNAAILTKRYGFSATLAPFKGAPDAITALAQHEIQFFPSVAPLATQFIQKKLVRPLTMMVDQRSPLLPEVPTLKGQGIDLPPLQYSGRLWRRPLARRAL
ncbi:hypothetical protein LZ683_06690 [Comamonas testosteroni]|uniref:tripartite tricarboxylate transporter substrate-binding protein n=1 Tax=Comamonas testosteroni TaxID=285 RepID=UPI0023AA8660|nr:tripartite tricarboxylate transporter substrate-binding protein [Comamonas testosteroni]WEE79073.1 hypothetical protein LZ683_06690 [Comamonas testosteroni]